MASDRYQFKRALEHWRDLKQQKEFSYSPKEGMVALLVSFADTSDESPLASADNFAMEARAFAKKFKALNIESVIIDDATGEDAVSVLRDRRISSIYTIGHGALSYIYMPNGQRRTQLEDGTTQETSNNRFDWRDASAHTDHLKLGSFVQRHCGNYARRLSVPLGAFVVANQRSVWAPVGSYFQPSSLQDSENTRMTRAIPHAGISYESVLQNFDHELFLKATVGDDEATAS